MVDTNGTIAIVERAELRRLRTQLGLTQAQLAAKLDVTVTAVWRWEAGQRRIPGPVGRLVQLLAEMAPQTAPKPRKRRR